MQAGKERGPHGKTGLQVLLEDRQPQDPSPESLSSAGGLRFGPPAAATPPRSGSAAGVAPAERHRNVVADLHRMLQKGPAAAAAAEQASSAARTPVFTPPSQPGANAGSRTPATPPPARPMDSGSPGWSTDLASFFDSTHAAPATAIDDSEFADTRRDLLARLSAVGELPRKLSPSRAEADTARRQLAQQLGDEQQSTQPRRPSRKDSVKRLQRALAVKFRQHAVARQLVQACCLFYRWRDFADASVVRSRMITKVRGGHLKVLLGKCFRKWLAVCGLAGHQMRGHTQTAGSAGSGAVRDSFAGWRSVVHSARVTESRALEETLGKLSAARYQLGLKRRQFSNMKRATAAAAALGQSAALGPRKEKDQQRQKWTHCLADLFAPPTASAPLLANILQMAGIDPRATVIASLDQRALATVMQKWADFCATRRRDRGVISRNHYLLRAFVAWRENIHSEKLEAARKMLKLQQEKSAEAILARWQRLSVSKCLRRWQLWSTGEVSLRQRLKHVIHRLRSHLLFSAWDGWRLNVQHLHNQRGCVKRTLAHWGQRLVASALQGWVDFRTARRRTAQLFC